MRVVELPDLNIKIYEIRFTPKFIKVKSFPLFTKNKQEFLFQISRELNEELVNELKIGMSYRITQEQIIEDNGRVNFKWLEAECLSQRKTSNKIDLMEVF